jgi:hypothetical protein
MLEIFVIMLVLWIVIATVTLKFMRTSRIHGNMLDQFNRLEPRGSQSDSKPLDDSPLYVPTRINFEGCYEAERAVWGHEWVHAGWPEPKSKLTLANTLSVDDTQFPRVESDEWFTRQTEQVTYPGTSTPVRDIKNLPPTINYAAAYLANAYGGKSDILGGGGGSTSICSVMYTCSVCGYTSDRSDDITPDCRVCMTRPCMNCKQPTPNKGRYCDWCLTKGICDCGTLPNVSHAADCGIFK